MRLSSCLWAIGFLAPLVSSQSFQVFYEEGLPDGVTADSTCGKALQASIACDPALRAAGDYFDDVTTASICKATCMTSLTSYRNNVASACKGVELEGDDITYPSTFLADYMIYGYNTTCLKDA